MWRPLMIFLFLGPPEMSAVLLVNYDRVARVRINVSSYTIVATDGQPRSYGAVLSIQIA